MSGVRGNNGSGLLVPDSPAVKRQRINDGGWQSTSNSTGYNSGADSGDDLFDGVLSTPEKHLTQPTQIIAGSRHETQPTQILEQGQVPTRLTTSPPRSPSGELQVPASSPFQSQSSSLQQPIPNSPSQSVSQAHHARSQSGTPQFLRRALPPNPALRQAPHHVRRGVASAMAPAGTSFRTPHGVVRAPVKAAPKPIIIDLSDDDGPQYKGGSSDEEGRTVANIKPSSFGASMKKSTSFDENRAVMPVAAKATATVQSDVQAARSQFSQIVQNAAYDPNRNHGQLRANGSGSASYSHPPARVSDAMSAGYGSRPRPTQTQAGPARAVPVDMRLIDVPDEDMRRKIAQIRNVFPHYTVRDINNALIEKKGAVDDAMIVLVLKEEEANALEADAQLPRPQQMNMRASLKAPIATISERFNQRDRPIVIPSSSPATPPQLRPQPQKRRLVQGRRRASSPVEPSPKKEEQAPITIDSDAESDSGIETEERESEQEDNELDSRVLSFLNNSSASELADLVSVNLAIVEGFIRARPFRSLADAEEYSDAKPTKTGKRSTRAPVGDKIVQNAGKVMQGYEAVDYVVRKCEAHSKPLAAEMAKWGFDMFGANKDGELAMTSLDEDSDGPKDSGIGTPNSKTTSTNGDEDVKFIKGRKVAFLKQPSIMSKDITLKDYQLVGLNWLNLIYKNQLSCILADDMGLGKTCQVISFLSHLVETGAGGPHLVVVPSSVLENWMREFLHFSPNLNVKAYAGSQSERADLAEEFLDNRAEIHVVVASYDNSRRPDDNKFLRQLRPTICVFDEGHALKNPDSQRYKTLMRVPADMRILLTGTPLQNNLLELAAVLAFILPEVFLARKDDLDYIFKHRAKTSDSDHAALLSTQRTQRARSMLTPFVLRRKKEQVLKHMPAKICRIEYCALEPAQAKIYKELASRASELRRLREEGIKTDEKGDNNPIMQLRKAAIHHMLFRRHFTDAKLSQMLPLLKRHEPDAFKGRDDQIMGEMQYHSDYILHGWCVSTPCIRKFDTPNLEWMNSGKVKALVKLLNHYKKNGDRVLIFSQFTMVLDILEAVLQTSLVQYTRIDGGTRVDERQTLIDQFRDNESITAFLLSTGAGGQGLNLMYANKVIIFDQSFNPQDDVQAENRAHRVGQTRDVEVVRLISKGTIEEAMYALGQSKLALDNKVSGGSEKEEVSFKKMMEDKVLEMLVEGKANVGGEEVKNEISVFDDDKEQKPADGGDSSSELSDVDASAMDEDSDS